MKDQRRPSENLHSAADLMPEVYAAEVGGIRAPGPPPRPSGAGAIVSGFVFGFLLFFVLVLLIMSA